MLLSVCVTVTLSFSIHKFQSYNLLIFQIETFVYVKYMLSTVLNMPSLFSKYPNLWKSWFNLFSKCWANVVLGNSSLVKDLDWLYNFVYRPGEVDPHIEPSRLFMVQRIKALRGQPYWIKDIIKTLKLDTDVSAEKWSLS